MKDVVVFDADSLIAYFDPDDERHNAADIIFQKILKAEVRAVFPFTAVYEAVTRLQKQKPKPKPHIARIIAEKFQLGSVPLELPSKELVLEAFTMYNPYSLGDTLFDALIAAIAKQYKAKAVVSFDHIYKQMDLKLAEDVF